MPTSDPRPPPGERQRVPLPKRLKRNAPSARVAPAVLNRGKQPRAGVAPWLPSASVLARRCGWAAAGGRGAPRPRPRAPVAPRCSSRRAPGVIPARQLSNRASGLGCVVFTVMSSVLGPPSASPPAAAASSRAGVSARRDERSELAVL